MALWELSRAVPSRYRHLPSFLWEEDQQGRSHQITPQGGQDTLRYAQEVIKALKHSPSSRSQRTHGFLIPTEFLQFSIFWLEWVHVLLILHNCLPLIHWSFSLFPHRVFSTRWKVSNIPPSHQFLLCSRNAVILCSTLESPSISLNLHPMLILQLGLSASLSPQKRWGMLMDDNNRHQHLILF